MYKYIYFQDSIGEVIGYVDKKQPGNKSPDIVFITLISHNPGTGWVSGLRYSTMAVDLRKTTKHQIFESYEEFCAQFFEAIL